MFAFVIDMDAPVARVFRTTTLANAFCGEAENFGVYTGAAGMVDNKSFTLAKMGAVYNAVAEAVGQPTVGKFANRTTAAESIEALLREHVEAEGADDLPEPLPPQKATNERAGRPSAYAGMRIVATNETLQENPRREGGVGWHLLEAIIEAGKKGMSWEEYAMLPGAGSNHLKWDIAHGNVTVK